MPLERYPILIDAPPKVFPTTPPVALPWQAEQPAPHSGPLRYAFDAPPVTQPIAADAPPDDVFAGRAPGPPPTTDDLRDRAHQQQVNDMLHSMVLFTSIAVGVSRMARPYFPGTSDLITETGTGFEPHVNPGSKRAWPKLGKPTLIGFAPPPLGYIPPEWYGLPPDFLIEKEKQKDPDKQRWIGMSVLKLMGSDPGGDRQDYWEAKVADAAAAYVRSRVGDFDSYGLQRAYREPWDVAPYSEFRFQRPGEIRQIVAEEYARRGLTPPDLEPWQRIRPSYRDALVQIIGPTPGSTFDVSAVEPVAILPKMSGDAAEPPRDQLVHERADP